MRRDFLTMGSPPDVLSNELVARLFLKASGCNQELKLQLENNPPSLGFFLDFLIPVWLLYSYLFNRDCLSFSPAKWSPQVTAPAGSPGARAYSLPRRAAPRGAGIVSEA